MSSPKSQTNRTLAISVRTPEPEVKNVFKNEKITFLHHKSSLKGKKLFCWLSLLCSLLRSEVPFFSVKPQQCHTLNKWWEIIYVPTIRAELMASDKQKCQFLKLIIWEKLPTIQWEKNNLSMDSYHCSSLHVDIVVHSRTLERKHNTNSFKLESKNVLYFFTL